MSMFLNAPEKNNKTNKCRVYNPFNPGSFFRTKSLKIFTGIFCLVRVLRSVLYLFLFSVEQLKPFRVYFCYTCIFLFATSVQKRQGFLSFFLSFSLPLSFFSHTHTHTYARTRSRNALDFRLLLYINK